MENSQLANHDESRMTFLDAALKLRELGCSVIPADAKGQPYVKWQEFERRVPTETEIRGWDSKYPGTQMTLVLGSGAGKIAAITDDDRCGQSDYGAIPETVTIRTADKNVYLIKNNGHLNDGAIGRMDDMFLIIGDGCFLGKTVTMSIPRDGIASMPESWSDEAPIGGKAASASKPVNVEAKPAGGADYAEDLRKRIGLGSPAKLASTGAATKMRTGFGRFPEWVNDSGKLAELSGSEAKVYLHILSRANSTTRDYHGYRETIAREAGVADSTVSAITTRLHALGLIRKETINSAKNNRRTTYWVIDNMPPAN